MDEVHIVSCVVRVRPQDMAAAAAAIEQSPCSEVFASHPDGKLVVVLERANSAEIMGRIDAMRELPGVLSVELAYQHAEAAAAMQEVLS